MLLTIVPTTIVRQATASVIAAVTLPMLPIIRTRMCGSSHVHPWSGCVRTLSDRIVNTQAPAIKFHTINMFLSL